MSHDTAASNNLGRVDLSILLVESYVVHSMWHHSVVREALLVDNADQGEVAAPV